MANTLNLGNGNWATKEDSLLAYNSENGNFKPLPFDFTRASSATVVNKAGLIETVGSGEPRIDFSNDAKGALLLEPQRLQLIQYSEDFSNSYWAKNNANVESNAAVSPDGTQNADKLNFTTSSGEIVKGMAFVSGQTYTMSFYAKTESGTLDFIYGNMNYSTISGTATNEWQRFVITQTLPTDTRFPKIQTTEIGSLLLWGWQVEQGSYATSYIPTQGSAVTRVADVCNNAGNEQVFNSTEGVLYFEGSALANDGTARRISLSGNSSNIIYISYRATENQIRAFITGYYDQTINISNSLLYNKFALKYKSGDISFWINGVKVNTSTNSMGISGLVKVNFDGGIGYQDFYGKTKDVRVYNTALTDAELQALTT